MQRIIWKVNVSPQERAEWEYKTKVGVAEAFAKVQLPKVVSAGSSNGSSSTAMDAMGLKMLIDLSNQLSK